MPYTPLSSLTVTSDGYMQTVGFFLSNASAKARCRA